MMKAFFAISGSETGESEVERQKRKVAREDVAKRLDAMKADLNGAGDRWFLCKRENDGDDPTCTGGSL